MSIANEQSGRNVDQKELVRSIKYINTALLSIVVASITAWMTAYFSNEYRSYPSVVISPMGFSVESPAMKVILTGEEVLSLDNMTSEPLPYEVKRIALEIRGRFADDITQTLSNDNKEFPQLRAMKTMERFAREEKPYEISIESAKEIIRLIDSRPSRAYRKYKSGEVNNSHKSNGEKIWDAVSNSSSVGEALQKIANIDRSTGTALKMLMETAAAQYKDDFDSFKIIVKETVVNRRDSQLEEEWEKILNKFRDLVVRAEMEAGQDTRYKLSISVSNTGQTPVSLSKFSILSTHGGDFILPMEGSDRDDRTVIAPLSTINISLLSPRRKDIPMSWQSIEQERNKVSANAFLEMFAFEPNKTMKSRDFSISTSRNDQKMITEKILSGRMVGATDVEKFIGK